MQVSVIGEVRNIWQETVDSLPYLKMSRLTLWLSVGVFMWGFASGFITCPDGSTCSDIATCCKTQRGYGCCQYPKAVCCADMLHCCPSGYRCNLVTQLCEKLDQPWLSIPMVKKDAAQKLTYPFLYKPALPSVPAFVIPMSEDTESMNEIPEPALTHVGSPEAQVIRCDSLYYCQGGMSCCQASTGQWNCCPYPLGQCCADGLHCCEYGYTCDASSLKCRNSYS